MFADMRCTENCIPTPAQALGRGKPIPLRPDGNDGRLHQNTFFSKQENVRFQYDVTFIPSGPGGQYSGGRLQRPGCARRG